MRTANEILLALAILLQIGDGVTTWLNLKRADRQEANKIVKWLMDRVGVIPALILLKLPFTALLVAGVVLYPSHIYITAALGAVCAVYVYIVTQNWKLLKL